MEYTANSFKHQCLELCSFFYLCWGLPVALRTPPGRQEKPERFFHRSATVVLSDSYHKHSSPTGLLFSVSERRFSNHWRRASESSQHTSLGTRDSNTTSPSVIMPQDTQQKSSLLSPVYAESVASDEARVEMQILQAIAVSLGRSCLAVLSSR